LCLGSTLFVLKYCFVLPTPAGNKGSNKRGPQQQLLQSTGMISDEEVDDERELNPEWVPKNNSDVQPNKKQRTAAPVAASPDVAPMES
jgi:hypothetical protein